MRFIAVDSHGIFKYIVIKLSRFKLYALDAVNLLFANTSVPLKPKMFLRNCCVFDALASVKFDSPRKTAHYLLRWA